MVRDGDDRSGAARRGGRSRVVTLEDSGGSLKHVGPGEEGVTGTTVTGVVRWAGAEPSESRSVCVHVLNMWVWSVVWERGTGPRTSFPFESVTGMYRVREDLVSPSGSLSRDGVSPGRVFQRRCRVCRPSRNLYFR